MALPLACVHAPDVSAGLSDLCLKLVPHHQVPIAGTSGIMDVVLPINSLVALQSQASVGSQPCSCSRSSALEVHPQSFRLLRFDLGSARLVVDLNVFDVPTGQLLVVEIVRVPAQHHLALTGLYQVQ